MKIREWIVSAEQQLRAAHIPSSRLDAELIACHTLEKSRSWLIAHDDEAFVPGPADILLARRLTREPIAYILGSKEFYGRSFIVTPDTLIPRPETETLIELAQEHHLTGSIVDIGTGSGCIGITLALETDADITLSDVSQSALDVAKKNVARLGASVHYATSDLLRYWIDRDQDGVFDVIVANLPYVDTAWERSPETDHEPSSALFADNGGLELILKLIEQSTAVLKPHGHLLLEADPEQHRAIIECAKKHGFRLIENRDYAVLLQIL